MKYASEKSCVHINNLLKKPYEKLKKILQNDTIKTSIKITLSKVEKKTLLFLSISREIPIHYTLLIFLLQYKENTSGTITLLKVLFQLVQKKY